ncbi:hypothetical protein IT412_00660 [Candidatus Peregrinibacteria bacterium]|nr:hypothetical protein [Candidatus Peregrinibacteria bacterium]
METTTQNWSEKWQKRLNKKSKSTKPTSKIKQVAEVDSIQKDIGQALANLDQIKSVSPEVEKTRLENQKNFNKIGEILSPDHYIHQKVSSIAAKLDMPAGTTVVVLDNEEFIAHYDTLAKEIVVSRGVLMHLQSKLSNFSEDHLAALLSHETEHAFADSKSTKNRQDYSTAEKVMASHDPAEEMRADTQGMRRAASAGYNPRAMIEILQTFGLTSGRRGTTHPETIDRIRYLEMRLASDEHPLANTTQKYQSFDIDFIKWTSQPSEVYQKTEKLRQSSFTELEEQLSQCQNISDYIQTYTYHQNSIYLAEAKKLKDNTLLQEIAVLMMACEKIRSALSINNSETFYYSEFSDSFDHGRYQKDLNKSKSHVDHLGDINTSATDLEKYQEFLQAEKIKLLEIFSALIKQTEIYISNLDPKAIDKLTSTEHSEKDGFKKELEAVELAKEVKQSIENDTLKNPDLFEKLFTEKMAALDSATIRAERLEKNRKAKAKGARLPYEKAEDLEGGVDFQDQQAFSNLQELYRYNLALRSIPKKSVEQKHVDQLKAIMLNAGCSEIEAAFFGRAFLEFKSHQEISKFLANLEKDRLVFLMDFFSNNSEINQLRISPIRADHLSLKSSQSLVAHPFNIHFNYVHHFPNGSVDSVGSGMRALNFIIAWEYYQRFYPAHYFEGAKPIYHSPETLGISESEWAMLEKSGLSGMNEEVSKLAIHKILDAKGDQSKLSPYIKNHLSNLTYIPFEFGETNLEEMIELSSYGIWDDLTTQKLFKILLSEYLEKSFDQRPIPSGKTIDFSDPENRKVPADTVKLARQIRELAKRSPSNYISKNRYDTPPTLSEYELSGKLQKIDLAINTKNFFQILETELAENNIIGTNLWMSEERIKLSKLSTTELQKLQGQPAINLPLNQEFKLLINFILKCKLSEHSVDPYNLSKSVEKFSKKNVVTEALYIIEGQAMGRGTKVQDYIDCVNEFILEQPLKQRYLLAIRSIIYGDDAKAEFDELVKTLLDYQVDKQGRDNATYDFQKILSETSDLLYDLNLEDFLEKNRAIAEDYFQKKLEDLSIEERREITVKLIIGSLEEDFKQTIGTGLQLDIFHDLVWRRFNLVEESEDFLVDGMAEWRRSKNPNEPVQKYLASRLREAEDTILNQTNLTDRIIELTRLAPEKTIVRDLYLEKFMRDALENERDQNKVLQISEQLWNLMTDKCPSRDIIAGIYLEAKFKHEPKLAREYDLAIKLINQYLPTASFAKNYFLEKVENSSDLSIEQLTEIISLRMSEEGKKDISDNGMGALVVNKINEMNRAERQAFYFWITGLSKQKPQSIFELEMRTAGFADSLVKLFALLNPREQVLMIDRLALGKEGIFDLEAVSTMEKVEASESRLNFVDQLLDKVFIDQNPSTKLLKKIMKVILLEADSHKASKILGKMTNTLIQAQLQNKKLSMPEIASLMLNELGVVGKKVSQSLAELEALPTDFRQEFKKAQSSAQLVPKRALADLADSYGLLDGKDGIKILSFGKMLGAASNKQACLLEVEITSNDYALPPGKHQLVGKFKRPSAQKTSNLEADLNLLEKALVAITSESTFANSLPSGFLDTIRDSVMRELDFEKEKSFSKLLHKDLKKLDQAGKDYQLGLPTIIYANADLVIETLAPGISLRDYLDQKAAQELPPAYQSVDQQKVMEKVLGEAIRELLISGNLHADLHPGNIFVSDKKQVTLIDIGMNEVLTPDQRESIAILLSGLTSGSDKLVKKALQKLGLNLPKNLNLKFNDFSNNTSKMIDASKESNQKIPPLITSLFSAISKLSTYSKELDSKAMIRILKEVGEMLVKQKVGFDFEFEVEM